MAFRVNDFKYLVRRSGERKLIYPHQLRDDRLLASIAFAIDYYERMVGRERASFEIDTLLEFFGEPKLARGLVACLGRTYIWQRPTLADALGAPAAALLAAAGVRTPADLRAKLYALANASYYGYIAPEQRGAALALLRGELVAQAGQPGGESRALDVNALDAAQIERALHLDDQGRQILAKVGQRPEASTIVARYNYHAIESALCQSGELRLTLGGDMPTLLRSVHQLAQRYQLRYTVGQLGRGGAQPDVSVPVTIHGARDALGGWGQSGRRVARLLVRLLAAHPGVCRTAEADVHLRGTTLRYAMDSKALAAFGAGIASEQPSAEPWESETVELFRAAWLKAAARGDTGGYRLRLDPEPIVGPGGLLVPDGLLVCGSRRVPLCLAPSATAAAALIRAAKTLPNPDEPLILVPDTAERPQRTPLTLIGYADAASDAIPAIVAALLRRAA